MIRIQLPGLNLHCGVYGLSAFLNRLAPAWDEDGEVTIDLKHCDFISAEGAAILSALHLHRECRSLETRIDWNTAASRITKQCGRWNLHDLFPGCEHPWTDNAIPLYHWKRQNSKSVAGFVDIRLRSGRNMPRMSDGLAKEVRRSLVELFDNVFFHSESAFGGFVIGQFHPKNKSIQLCVCDGGIGLVKKVQTSRFKQPNDAEAAKWALETGNTTREDTGGTGLSILRSFVHVNEGELHILANRVYLSEKNATLTTEFLSNPFRGTLFQMKLHVRDDKVYVLSDET